MEDEEVLPSRGIEFCNPIDGKGSQQVGCFERLEVQFGDRPLPLPNFRRYASALNQSPDADVLASRKVKKYEHGDHPALGRSHSLATNKQRADVGLAQELLY
jgi:hypothetical protein